MNTAQMANDLAFMVADLPDSITMDMPDGRTFACSTGQASKSKALKDEGFMGVYDLSVVIQASLLVDGAGNVSLINERQKFTHARSGLKMRVERVIDSQDGVSVTLQALQVTS